MLFELDPRYYEITHSRQYVSVRSRPESEIPLSRGPVYGLFYCLAGLGAGFAATAIAGWVSVALWVVAGFLFLAGLWTVLFTGGLLLLIRWAERKADERPS